VFSFIAAEKANYPVAVMCRALKVNRTSFHAWQCRPPSDRDLADAWLLERIRSIHQAVHGKLLAKTAATVVETWGVVGWSLWLS